MKNIKSIIYLLSIFVSSSLYANPNDEILLKLAYREMTQFALNGEIRSLLNDQSFEKDLRKWWQAVNPYYVSDALSGQYEEEKYPQMSEYASKTHLKENNQKILDWKSDFSYYLGNYIPSEKISIYISYFLMTNQIELAQRTLEYYLVHYALFAKEILEDPRLDLIPSKLKQTLLEATPILSWDIQTYRKCSGLNNLEQIGTCQKDALFTPEAKNMVSCLEQFKGLQSLPTLGQCFKISGISFVDGKKNNLTNQILTQKSYFGAAHLISPLGFIKGNDLQYFTQNRRDQEVTDFMENLYSNNQNPIFDWAQSHQALNPLAFVDLWTSGVTPFSDSLFLKSNEHPSFQIPSIEYKNNSIFPEIIHAIRSAKHTIFIDVFFFGGTLGKAISDELLAKAESGVKIYFLHDQFNPFNYGKEIRPLFDSLLAYSKLNPNKMVAVGSYIFAHRTGLPSYFDMIFPDQLVDSLTQALPTQGIPLFPKAKSDHSKVMVIDGAGLWEDSLPVAYVGSKNWTDSSGSMTYDEVIKVSGPAAIAIQDDYYWDFWYALQAQSENTKLNDKTIDNILQMFDPLQRSWDPVHKKVVLKTTQIKSQLNTKSNLTVRLGSNSVDGSITNALDQNISLIRSAKKQIIINDQFLYDRRIVEEILDKAESSPQVEIYIMLEPLSKTSGREIEELAGFPNNLYADILMFDKVKINPLMGSVSEIGKKRKNIHLKWKFIPENKTFHFEYHMKTISIDGFDSNGTRVVSDSPAVLITGSANKDHMTMYGAFREMQVEAFDNRPCLEEESGAISCGVVAEADRVFWKRWNASPEDDGSVPVSPYGLSIPEKIQKIFRPILGRDLARPEFISYMRKIMHLVYELEYSHPSE